MWAKPRQQVGARWGGCRGEDLCADDICFSSLLLFYFIYFHIIILREVCVEVGLDLKEIENMAATQRLSSVLAHLNPLSESTGRAKVLQKNPDDIVRPLSLNFFIYLTGNQVITYAARTPLTKAKKGALKDTPIDDLLIALLTVPSPSHSPLPKTNSPRSSASDPTSTPPSSKMSVSATCSPRAKATWRAPPCSPPAIPSRPPPP